MRSRPHTRKFADADVLGALPASLAELAERFEVARSTVYRRLEALARLGYVDVVKGRERGARWVVGSVPIPPGQRNVQGLAPYYR